VIDTLRRDRLSCYGGERRTPNIDALAAQGQRFEAAFASFHQTSMSMASLFTGRTPSIESGTLGEPLDWNGRNWCGLRRFAGGSETPACVPAALPTLAERLREAGYHTIGIASNALLFRPAGFERGFDLWSEVGAGPDVPPARLSNAALRAAPQVNAAAAAALEARASDRFFLYVHYMDVHDYQPTAELVLRETGSRLPQPYAGGVARTDRAVGALLAHLASLGLTEDLVIFLTSDHGERLGEDHLLPGHDAHDGNPSFEELLRIPLIVSPPVFPDPTRFTRTEDLHHMILRLAGAVPDRAPELAPGEMFTSEARFQTYREGRFKSFRDRAGGTLRLVDLREDPGETRDVAERHPDVARDHGERLDALTRELAAKDAPPSALTEQDRSRLRSLGYLE
jgi:arylsulfatase A-like enzyme